MERGSPLLRQAGSGSDFVLLPIEPNTIAHPDSGVDPYVVAFYSSGRRYFCPLLFQPRILAETQARDSLAVQLLRIAPHPVLVPTRPSNCPALPEPLA